jgi:hypothetical protein
MADQSGYLPTPGPNTDDPQLQQVVQWTQRELEALARQFTNFDVVQQNVLHVEPDKPREGMVVVADGVNWNPGHGAGQYTYIGGVWVYSGNTVTLPDMSHFIRNDTSTTTTVGYLFTAYSLGTGSGTVTPNAANGNYQFITNNGAFTLAPMVADSAIDLLVTNGASAGGLSLGAGWTYASSPLNIGDSYVTTNGFKFIFSLRRINGIATLTIKALQ